MTEETESERSARMAAQLRIAMAIQKAQDEEEARKAAAEEAKKQEGDQ